MDLCEFKDNPGLYKINGSDLKEKQSQRRWLTLLIPILGRWRQEETWLGLHEKKTIRQEETGS